MLSLRILRAELGRIVRRPVYRFFLAAAALYQLWEVLQLADVPSGPVRHNAPASLDLRATFLMLYLVGTVALPWLCAEVGKERFSGTRDWVDQCRPRSTLMWMRWLAISLAGSLVAAVGLLVFRFVPALIDVDRYAFGTFTPWSTLRAWLVFALIPCASFAGLLLFLAERVRRMSVLYGAAVAFVALWFALKTLGSLFSEGTLLHALFAALEPFGTVAHVSAVRGWGPEQLNAALVPIDGLMLANRALWLALGVLSVATLASRRRRVPAAMPAGRSPFGATSWKVAGLAVVLLAASTLRSVRRFDGTLPTTDVLVHDLEGPLRIVTLGWAAIAIVGAFCLHDVHRTDAWLRTASASATRVALRALSRISLGAVGLYALAMAALFCGQLALTRGVRGLPDTLWLYPLELFVFQLPTTIYLIAFALAAALATRRRVAVLGALLLPFVLDQAFAVAGQPSDLFRPAMVPDLDYSFMAGFSGQWVGHLAYLLHWAILSALVLAVSVRRWARWLGRPVPIQRRGLLALSLAFVASHALILYNVASLNGWNPPTLLERMAAYEDAWGHVRGLRQPVLAGGDYRVDLFPSSGRTQVRGTLRIVNPHAVAVPAVHLAWHHELVVEAIEWSGADVQIDTDRSHAELILDAPLAPGADATLRWRAHVPPEQGFRDIDRRASQTWASEVQTLPGGTNILNLRLLPTVGYLRRYEHGAAWARSRFRLGEGAAVPDRDDPRAASVAHGASHLGRGDWRLVLSTEAPQTPVAGGRLVRRFQSGGRNVAEFVNVDSLGWTHLISGTYASRRAGESIELFHHPGHDWNADELASTLEASFDWFAQRFGGSLGGPIRVAEVSFHHGGWGALGGSAFASEIDIWKADASLDGGARVRDFARFVAARTFIRDHVVPADVAGAKTIHRGLIAALADWCADELDASPERARARRQRRVDQWVEGRALAEEEGATPLEEYRDSRGARSLLPLRLMRLRAQVGEKAFADA
ncbi:MAG: hypothetical protein AAF938_13240, partial [Myxococcota bacterium]